VFLSHHRTQDDQALQLHIVKIEGLSHRYGIEWAIRDINFAIDRLGIVGLLGSNGAGKSTTMNILCGVLNQTEGTVCIEGIDLRERPEEAKRLLGFLPQTPPLYLDCTVNEYLTYCAHLRLIAKANIPLALRRVQERCGIAHMRHRLIRNLSGGYRQRVGIAQAIIHKPKLVVLDEPTNGLDPVQIVGVRELIREIAEDHSVVLSTHILSEVEAICQRIVMIERGRVVFSDSIEAFNGYVQPFQILMQMMAPPPTEVLHLVPGVTAVNWDDAYTVRLDFSGSPDITQRLIERSVAEGWQLREIQIERISLESVFAHLSGQSTGVPRS